MQLDLAEGYFAYAAWGHKVPEWRIVLSFGKRAIYGVIKEILRKKPLYWLKSLLDRQSTELLSQNKKLSSLYSEIKETDEDYVGCL